MKVNEKCIGCGDCLPYCPQGAISINDQGCAVVDRGLCVECGVCFDTDICPVSAFEADTDAIAQLKKQFGGLATRKGGYDIKANDVMDRIPAHKVAIRFELNRPAGGLQLGLVKQLRCHMQQLGWHPEVSRHYRSLLDADLPPESLEQQIFMAFIEVVVDPEDVPEAVNEVARFVTKRGLWVSISISGIADMIHRLEGVLEKAGLQAEPVAKANLGLGKRRER